MKNDSTDRGVYQGLGDRGRKDSLPTKGAFMTDRRAIVSVDKDYKGKTDAILSDPRKPLKLLNWTRKSTSVIPCFTLFTPSRCKALNPIKPLQPVHSPKPQTLLNPQALDTQVPLNPLNPGRNVVLGEKLPCLGNTSA